MTRAFSKLQSLGSSIALSLLVALGACTVSNKTTTPVQSESQPSTPSTSNNNNPDKAATPYQGGLTNVDGLSEQSKKTNPELKKKSKSLYDLASKAEARGEWGAATKFFAESALFMPTNEALIAYASAQARSDVKTNDPKKTLETRLRTFQMAVDGYKTAAEFSRRINTPLTGEQAKLIEANVTCLKTFIKTPNPAKPTCDLVAEALKVSNIK